MNKKLTSVSILISMATLISCATPQTRAPKVDSANALSEAQKQREMVIEDFVSTNKRLQAVASKVIVSNAGLCADKVKPYYGFSAWNNEMFKDDWKRAAEAKYNLTGQIHVSYVAAGSEAELAGLKEGDIIQAINGKLTAYGKDATNKFADNLKETGKQGEPIEFTIRSGSEEKKISIKSVPACDFNVLLSPDDIKNAYADGKNIVFMKGMMDFFKTEEEIALVFSHELAHNSMKHIDAKKKNAVLGGVLGFVLDIAAAAGGVNTNGDFTRLGANAGGGAYSVEFEQEADYVGLYFMALAGYKIDDAPNFWRRMATNNSASITIKSTHPTAPERFLALETTVKEIKDKIANGQPLTPEMKEPAQAIQPTKSLIN